MDQTRVAASDLLAGQTVKPMTGDHVVVGALILLKTMNPDGDLQWTLRTTTDFSMVELIGALTVTLDKYQGDFLDDWEAEDEDG